MGQIVSAGDWFTMGRRTAAAGALAALGVVLAWGCGGSEQAHAGGTGAASSGSSPSTGAAGGTSATGATSSTGSSSGSCVRASSGTGSCGADLMTDPANCGACGHGCLGGACSGGLCGPVSLVSSVGLTGVWYLAVDETTVYWDSASVKTSASDYPPPVLAGALKSAPSSGSNGVIRLGSGKIESGIYSPGPVAAVPTAKGEYYWTQLVDVLGGAAQGDILNGATGYIASQIAVGAHGLFYGGINGSAGSPVPTPLMLFEAPFPGNTALTTLPSGPNADAFALTADDANVYWLVAQQQAGPGPTLSAALMQLPTSGGPAVEIAAADVSFYQVTPTEAIGPIASDGAHVFWAVCDNATLEGKLWRVAVGGGPLETVWQGSYCLSSLVVDASYVYAGGGTLTHDNTSDELWISEIPKGGGADTKIVTWSPSIHFLDSGNVVPGGGLPVQIAQDATSLYFAGMNEDHIWKVAKPGGWCTGGACACPEGQVQCGAVTCTDNQSDLENCGCCGASCAAGACSAGACSCPAPAVMCDGACTDPMTDPRNCGGCGMGCPTGAACAGGQCCPSGTYGEILCGGKCVDTTSDPDNCAGCGTVCPGGGTCSHSTCCAAGSIACPPFGCVDLQTDTNNCGSCGNECEAPTSACVGGSCACPSGESLCGTSCTPTATDPQNCGACGATCQAPTSACANGSCACPTPGEDVCGGVCIDVQGDGMNCGGCGNVCPGGTLCMNGACACPLSGDTPCGGQCVDTFQDPENCGSCGIVCTSPKPLCVEGTCACNTTGGTPCGSACVDTQTDLNNCGSCGNVCGEGMTCTAGACVPCPSCPDF